MSRESIYDYIRVIACFCVVGIHCTCILEFGMEGIDQIINYMVYSLFIIGLPVFFVLTGALLLPKNYRYSLKKFYLKKFEKLVIPFLVYALFYAVWVNDGVYALDCVRRDEWKTLLYLLGKWIVEIFGSYPAVHLWFMYSIIGIYLVIPFLSNMVRNMDYQTLLEGDTYYHYERFNNILALII